MKEFFPNILIVCGAGRNVGKTALIRSIINHQKERTPIAAIKFSPHKHEGKHSVNLLCDEKDYSIFLENNVTTKDSSLFLQAGANPVYYVETSDSMIETAFKRVVSLIGNESMIVCESGKLAGIIKPGVLIFVESTNPALNKKNNYKDIADLVVTMKPGEFDNELNIFNNKILVAKNRWLLS